VRSPGRGRPGAALAANTITGLLRHAVYGAIENVGEDELNERVALPPSQAERVVSVSAGSGPVQSLETMPESAANATRIGGVLPLVVAVRLV
jgi:hypothetical protein